MIKKINDVLRLVLSILACSIFVDQAPAQTILIDKCVSRLNDSDNTPTSQLEWRFLLVDALAEYDLEKAAIEVENNLEAAEATDDRNLIAISLVDSVLTNGLLNNFDNVPDKLWKAIERYDATQATAAQAIHFNASYIWCQLAIGIEIERLDSNFVSLKKAIDDCENDDVVLTAVAQLVLNPRGELSVKLTRDELLQVLNLRLKKTHSAAGRFAKAWIESQITNATQVRKKPKDIQLEEAGLLECLSIAEEANANFLLMRAYRNLGFFYFQNKLFAKASDAFELWRGYAEKLNYPSEIIACSGHLAALKDRIGDPLQGIQLIEQARKSKELSKCSFENRQALFDLGMHMYASINDARNTSKFGKLVADRETVLQLNFLKTQLTKRANEAAENLIDKQAQEAVSALLKEKLVENEALARSTKTFYQTALLSTIVGVLGCIMGAALLISRRRVRTIRDQLDSERESAREDALVRRRLENKVSHMQKMESLGMLAGGVAHDFNNLLVGVMCNAEVIKMHGQGKDGFIDDRTQQIINSAEKAAELSRQMLAYAGKQKIEWRRIDLNRLINDLTPILNSAGGKTSELKLSLSPVPVVAEVDATQIEQVLINLVTNARQAMKDSRSPVIIRTGIESVVSLQDDPNVVGRKSEPGEFAYFEVEDFGCGIPAEDLQRIYEPFYSKDRLGRGLGLAVVYGIVDGHEGLIRTVSAVGKGTRIRILLPKPNSDAAEDSDLVDSGAVHKKQLATIQRQDETHLVQTGPHSNSNSTILVVDDQVSVLNSTRQLLEMDGWRVITKNCGNDALGVLSNPAEQVVGMLLDVVMPDLNGDAVLEEMMARSIKVKVVLMSGYSQTQLDEYLQHPLVVGVIKKPFRMNEILELMNRVFGAERIRK